MASSLRRTHRNDATNMDSRQLNSFSSAVMCDLPAPTFSLIGPGFFIPQMAQEFHLSKRTQILSSQFYPRYTLFPLFYANINIWADTGIKNRNGANLKLHHALRAGAVISTKSYHNDLQ